MLGNRRLDESPAPHSMNQEHNVVDFVNLENSDLIVDALYKGGPNDNLSADPISKLLNCGTSGGFRIRGQFPKYKFVGLYSSLDDLGWPDTIDLRSGILTYYGDNKTPGKSLSSGRGNKLLEFVFAELQAGKRGDIPPFFIFTRGPIRRDVVFRGLAVPGVEGFVSQSDLTAV